jgi:hypothetical protein
MDRTTKPSASRPGILPNGNLMETCRIGINCYTDLTIGVTGESVERGPTICTGVTRPLRPSIALLVMSGVVWAVDVWAPAVPVFTEPPPPRPTAGTWVEEITVIGVSPLRGSGIDGNKVPNTTRVLSNQDLSREGTPALTGARESQVVC